MLSLTQAWRRLPYRSAGGGSRPSPCWHPGPNSSIQSKWKRICCLHNLFSAEIERKVIVSIFLDQFHKAMPTVTFSCKDTACNMFDLTFSHNMSEEKRYHFVLKEHKIFNRNWLILNLNWSQELYDYQQQHAVASQGGRVSDLLGDQVGRHVLGNTNVSLSRFVY